MALGRLQVPMKVFGTETVVLTDGLEQLGGPATLDVVGIDEEDAIDEEGEEDLAEDEEDPDEKWKKENEVEKKQFAERVKRAETRPFMLMEEFGTQTVILADKDGEDAPGGDDFVGLEDEDEPPPLELAEPKNAKSGKASGGGSVKIQAPSQDSGPSDAEKKEAMKRKETRPFMQMEEFGTETVELADRDDDPTCFGSQDFVGLDDDDQEEQSTSAKDSRRRKGEEDGDNLLAGGLEPMPKFSSQSSLDR
jgi:hypothetical protein